VSPIKCMDVIRELNSAAEKQHQSKRGGAARNGGGNDELGSPSAK